MSDDAPDTSPTGEPPICAAARALVGLTEDDDAYRAIVDPAGAPSEEALVAHDVSSCMLVAAWLLGWRGRFVPDTIQVTLARLWGSGLRLPDVDNLLGPGAQVWWAANPASGAVEHVDGCVVAVERHTLYAVSLTVVAGGQRDAAGRHRSGRQNYEDDEMPTRGDVE